MNRWIGYEAKMKQKKKKIHYTNTHIHIENLMIKQLSNICFMFYSDFSLKHVHYFIILLTHF